MDVVFDCNLGNKIHRGLITLRLCGFPFVEIEVVLTAAPAMSADVTILPSVSVWAEFGLGPVPRARSPKPSLPLFGKGRNRSWAERLPWAGPVRS
jgi:hypothetical protein